MKAIVVVTFFFLFTLLFSNSAHAQVFINEFSSNSNPEWVELYNSESAVDLTGWTISDEVQAPISLTGTLNPNSYFVYEKAQGWLNNSGGDVITLKDSSGQTKDSIEYGKSGSVVGTPDSDKSASRIPDGSSTWQNNTSSTKGSANPAPTSTPTPTSLPTNTPTPTQSPTNTPTPTKTPTPTPTKASSQTVNPTITPTLTPTKMLEKTPTPKSIQESSVLSENIATESLSPLLSPTAQPSPTPPTVVAGFFEQNLPKIFIIGGGLFLLGAGILFYKTHLKEGFDETDSDN